MVNKLENQAPHRENPYFIASFRPTSLATIFHLAIFFVKTLKKLSKLTVKQWRDYAVNKIHSKN